jgi:hypothetical protein
MNITVDDVARGKACEMSAFAHDGGGFPIGISAR